MARNREPVKAVESQSESSEEEEGSSSEEESDSELEPTQTTLALKKSQPQMPPKSSPPLPAPSSSSEEDSGSETESESDAPDSNVRPLAAKPLEDSQKSSRKARSIPVTPTPTKSAAAKRAAEDTPAKDAIMPNEESRLKRDDPLTAILAQTDASEPLKWELKQQPGMSPPRGGFNPNDPNQQIVAEDIFDEYGGFLSEVNIPELLTNFSTSKTKKKKSEK